MVSGQRYQYKVNLSELIFPIPGHEGGVRDRAEDGLTAYYRAGLGYEGNFPTPAVREGKEIEIERHYGK